MQLNKYLRISFVIILLFSTVSSPSKCAGLPGWGQNASADSILNARGELYFSFHLSHELPESLKHEISIDRIKGNTIFAYANRAGFNAFLLHQIHYQILTPPSQKYYSESDPSQKSGLIIDNYPGYKEYIELMRDFEQKYPDLCKLYELGTTHGGRSLLAVKISDHVTEKEPEPEFLFTSSMHGDEVVGYVLLLQLIDHLLSNYSSSYEIQNIVNNVEIWINPNANPDGTYFQGNNSVVGAKRFNLANVDLNRNFPEAFAPIPELQDVLEPEIHAMVNLMIEHNFTLSANYHGGAEVVNYPWDIIASAHPDNEWFVQISKCYADTVKKYGGVEYFTDISSDGITNGYAWYQVSGSRQDFACYHAHGREVTIEVSHEKMPPASQLNSYWEYNRQAMLDYISQSLFGIHGVVYDSLSGEPLSAHVFLPDHDDFHSFIISNADNGDFHRLVSPGNYQLQFTCNGYEEKTISDVHISNEQDKVWVDVALVPLTYKLKYYINNAGQLTVELPQESILRCEVFDLTGKLISSYYNPLSPKGSNYINLPESIPVGMYIAKIMINNNITESYKFGILENE